ncbi:NADH:flavin oxidoreductase/NADH oxidase family protein [Eremomyces bilateralis CBS 781.70]|uniref:NADH:flavin oxidoreductase/NADH oxidase family protein n=1 Tax=Eremomyces bilateralis CBS 781.70 TaxID=1392243 RepID=A0A6G1FS63_9PEZI|nr:NADH:flavin oxidoreductase/NADH oxidase family protein [Eremomyces bilateralis CBS 781.70]KAF1808624.1 NADH:flavin oxidoreductase/NADH oxidase family protein [Eremomyces bilateralis CBS 781.70]
MENSNLFKPLTVGKCDLAHRIAMAPLTRFRAQDNHVPTIPLSATYYAQRACVPGTLLISEATFISDKASGMPNVPGLWSLEQLTAWREITDAVHAEGSKIYCQLWALGRAAAQPVMEAKGLEIVSSSAVPMTEKAPVPRALSEEEIWEFVGVYAQAAKNAVEVAGFDGVEIHGANGYLIDQFTQDTCNKRTDQWGGSIEKRSRFAIEIAKAIVKAVGSDRAGIRLSPWGTFQGMLMDDPIPQFTYLIGELKKIGLAYIHLTESRVTGPVDITPSGSLHPFVDAWGEQPVIIAGGYTAEKAREAVDVEYKGKPVVIAFGRHFISNPDLVFRTMKGIPFTKYNRKTFYIPKNPVGYTDYPHAKEFGRPAASKI